MNTHYRRHNDVAITTYVKGNLVLSTTTPRERRWCRSRGYQYTPLAQIETEDRKRSRRGECRFSWTQAKYAMIREANGAGA